MVLAAAEALAESARTLSADAWFKMKTRCPVLDGQDMCSAYGVRPPACSTHFVLSDPDCCDPWSATGSEYVPADLKDVYVDSQRRIRESLPSSGIMSMVLPLPLALLVADRIAVRTDMSVEQALDLIRET